MHAAEPPCIMVKEMEEIREHIFIHFFMSDNHASKRLFTRVLLRLLPNRES